MIVRTIDKHFNGYKASVKFVRGVGETDDPYLIRWFTEHGYIVGGELDSPPSNISAKRQRVEDMSIEELKQFAKNIGKGKGVGILTTKEQILKHIMK